MLVRTVEVYRTARYAVLGEGPVEELWVACHGYGQLARYFVRPFRALEAPGRLVVAPEGLSRFYVDDGDGRGTYERVGASWMTRDDRETEIADSVRWIDRAVTDALEHAGTPRPRRLVAFGFSQGGAAVVRWLTRSPTRPARRCDRLVLWGAALPPDLDLTAHAAWLDGRLVLVRGQDDPFVPPERIAEEVARLRAHGIAFEEVVYDGGHRLEADVLRRVAELPFPT